MDLSSDLVTIPGTTVVTVYVPPGINNFDPGSANSSFLNPSNLELFCYNFQPCPAGKFCPSPETTLNCTEGVGLRSGCSVRDLGSIVTARGIMV